MKYKLTFSSTEEPTDVKIFVIIDEADVTKDTDWKALIELSLKELKEQIAKA